MHKNRVIFFYIKIWVFSFSWSIRFGKNWARVSASQYVAKTSAPAKHRPFLPRRPNTCSLPSPDPPAPAPHWFSTHRTLTLLFIHLFVWREERQELLCHCVYGESGEGNKRNRVYDRLSLARLPLSPWPALRTFKWVTLWWLCPLSLPRNDSSRCFCPRFFTPWLWQFECLNYFPFPYV